VVELVRHPVANTLADVGVYTGLPLEELFRRRSGCPGARADALAASRGHQRGPRVSVLHVPLEPKFRRHYREQCRETHRVYARRIRPATAGRGPAPVPPRLHAARGLPRGARAACPDGAAAQRRGHQLQPPYHGRGPAQRALQRRVLLVGRPGAQHRAVRQTLLDARTLLSVLLREDTRPVGVAGLSLGGALTLNLACLDERSRSPCPRGHDDLEALVADAPIFRRMRRDLRSFGGPAAFARFVADMGWRDLRRSCRSTGFS